MFTRKIEFAVACSALAFGCAELPSQRSETQEIIDNLVKAGFPADDIMVVDDVVYVGRDAEVTLAASREMLQGGDSSKEQYRTTNLISPDVERICVNGAALASFSSKFSAALDLAIDNYNALGLTFQIVRTSGSTTGCNATITAQVSSGTGASSGFPSGGLPFNTINIGSGLNTSTFSVDTVEHVITHELGHCVGLRHSDWFNRSISCGSGGSEGDAGVGAIHIPGTPTGATAGGSVMNSCFRTFESGEFIASDIIALDRLYDPIVSGTFADGATNALVQQSLQVTVEGPDRDLVTDANGVPTTSFTVTSGTLSFRVAARVTPSEPTPVNITLVAQGNGVVPTSIPMTIIKGATQFSLRIASLANPPSGVATAQVQGQAATTGAVVSQIQLQATESVSSVVATVTVPAGTVITDVNGVPLSGTLTMNGAYFNPTVGSSLAAFPGGFSVDTTDANGQTSPGEFLSAGLMSVEITDASGRQAKNFSGNGIQIAMEIPDGTVNPITNRLMAPGDVIPIFSNDTATGRWFDEGTATATTAPNGRLVAAFNAKHLSLWNLDFKVDRCPNIGTSTGFKSRRITVFDVFGLPVCPGKMKALRVGLSLVGGSAPTGYLRVFAPSGTEANVIQFLSAPKVGFSSISVFRDTNSNNTPDGMDNFFGGLSFQGAANTENNLCPNQTDSASLFLFVPQSQLPGSC